MNLVDEVLPPKVWLFAEIRVLTGFEFDVGTTTIESVVEPDLVPWGVVRSGKYLHRGIWLSRK